MQKGGHAGPPFCAAWARRKPVTAAFRALMVNCLRTHADSLSALASPANNPLYEMYKENFGYFRLKYCSSLS